jgi:hypothetical protein
MTRETLSHDEQFVRRCMNSYRLPGSATLAPAFPRRDPLARAGSRAARRQ